MKKAKEREEKKRKKKSCRRNQVRRKHSLKSELCNWKVFILNQPGESVNGKQIENFGGELNDRFGDFIIGLKYK